MLARDFNTPRFFERVESDKKLDAIVSTNEEVLKFCKDIDISKSSCVKNISSRVMKDALIYLSEKFTKLINLSFRSGLFPNLWKIAQVTPLFTGGNSNMVGNYRRVSLLPLP